MRRESGGFAWFLGAEKSTEMLRTCPIGPDWLRCRLDGLTKIELQLYRGSSYSAANALEDTMERYLVERAQAGDRDAFDELAASIGDRLYAVAYRIMRDRDAAGEATQQALVAIWRALPSLRDTDGFDAWSYRVTVNACRDELRLRRRSSAELRLVTRDQAVSDSALDVATRDELEHGFSKLSSEHRAVVILFYYLDWSMDQIAHNLGLPMGTVRSRLHYAKRHLRAEIEADRRSSLQKDKLA